MFGLGAQEILIVLVIALLVFGPTKLPEIGRQIGGAMREFRKMTGDVQRAFDLDDYTRDRYSYNEPATYQDEVHATWNGNDADTPAASDAGAEATALTVARGNGAQVYDDARPWSVEDDGEPYAAESASAYGDDQADYRNEQTSVAVLTAEPPGPPNKKEES